MLLLSACGNSGHDTKLTDDTGSKSTAAVTDPTLETVLSDEELYHNFLVKLHKKLNAIIGDDTHLDGFDSQSGMAGIAEIAMTDRMNVINEIGYAITDINQDGILELVLCRIEDSTAENCVGSRILCAYTVSEGNMVLLLEGSEANSFFLLEDGTVYNEIKSDSANAAFGTYGFDSAKNAYTCVDFYFEVFTEGLDAKHWHNHTGECDESASEPFAGDEGAFQELMTGFITRIVDVDLLPMSGFEA